MSVKRETITDLAATWYPNEVYDLIHEANKSWEKKMKKEIDEHTISVHLLDDEIHVDIKENGKELFAAVPYDVYHNYKR